MKTEELVSIIVPVYNIRDYLLKCLTSIIEQTYNNVEILIIDDGSTDGSEKICDEFEKRSERIRVFHKKNGGLSEARNYGIRKSHGEMIALIDGDDYVEKTYISQMMSRMKKDKSDIVVCGFNEEHENDICLDGVEATKKLLIEQKNIDIIACNKLYKRKLFFDNDIWYPVGEKYEDSLTTYKFYSKAGKVSYISKELYYYVRREGSIMGEAKTIERLKARRKAAIESKDYFKNDEILKEAASVSELTAVYAFIDAALRGEIDKKYVKSGMEWIKKKKNEYDDNNCMTKKLRIYIVLTTIFSGTFYKLFRKILHE